MRRRRAREAPATSRTRRELKAKRRASPLETRRASPPVKVVEPRLPERTCVGCRARRPQADLVRVALAPDGSLVVGRTAPGRGAWLCKPALGCLQMARKRRGFDKAFRQPVSAAALHELDGALESSDER